MTSNTTHDKVRAVFLTALMIMSVFGGTVAFTGTAVANVSGATLSESTVSAGTGVSASISDDAGNTGSTLYAVIDEDGEDDYDSGEESVSASSTDDGNVVTLGELDTSGLSEGSYTVYFFEADSTPTDGGAFPSGAGADTATLTIENTAPALDSATPDTDGSETEEKTEIEVTISDDTGVDDTTVDTGDFSISPGSIKSVNTNVDGSNVIATITLQSAVDAASIDVTLTDGATIADTNGNELTSSDAGTVTADNMDGVAPSVENVEISDVTNGDGSVKSGDTVEVSADVSDGGSGIDTVTTDASDFGAGSLELTDDDGDGTYTATFEVGSEGASEGDYSLTVTAADKQGNTNNGDTGTLTVNTIPSVKSASISNAPITDSETGTEQTVTVEFTEAMDTETSPTVEIVGVTDGPLTVSESSFSGSTWTGSVTIPDNDEEVTANISVAGAKDEEGNTISPSPDTSSSFEIDSTSPTVENVDVTNAPINIADADDLQVVTVTFSEEMDTSNSPTVVVQDADGNEITTVSQKDGVSNNGFGVNDGFDSDAKTWTGVVDLSNSNYDGTATVVVSGVQDPSQNDIDMNANTGTFEMDTEAPSLSTSFVDGDLKNGEIDLTSLFSADKGDSDGLSITYEVNGEVVDSETGYDTSMHDDGSAHVSATAVDDAGNPASADGVIIIDNNDPSVSAKLSDDEPIAGSVSVTEAFDIQKGDTETVHFEYSTDGGVNWNDVGDGEDSELDDSLDLSTHEGDTIQLRVTVTDADGTTESTAKVNDLYVDNLDQPDVSVTQNDDGTFTVVVTPEAGAKLTDINVALEAQNELASYEDGYSASTRTLTTGDFTETTTNIGDYQYTATVTAEPADAANLHDGKYNVKLQSVTDNNDRTYDGSGSVVATGVVDTGPVQVDHAYIKSAQDGQTTITVQFDEPIDTTDLSADDFEFRGQTVNSLGNDQDGSDGVITVQVNKNIQTGDAPNITVVNHDDIKELSDGDGTQSGVAEYDKHHSVASIKLQLEDGLNTVSVPAASGKISADALFQENSYVKAVWTYDAETNSWSSYDPRFDDEAPLLEGGEGFIVLVETPDDVPHDDISLYVNTKVGNGWPNPTEQHLEKGWNLVGHYQEGSQSISTAFGSASGAIDQAYTQTAASTLEYSRMDTSTGTFEPGAGYWVYVDADDVIYTEQAYETA